MTAILVGFIFYRLNIPAGWLLGSLLTGLVCGIFITKLTFKRTPFTVTLTFIGANIGLLLSIEVLKAVRHYIIPLLIMVFILIVVGALFSVLLYKKSGNINKHTAFFCCIPGGASEVIGVSDDYGADERIVAAFHSVRIIFFTMTIPLIISVMHSPVEVMGSDISEVSFDSSTVIFFIIVMISSFFLAKKFSVPGGALLFSILIGFLMSQFIIDVDQVPGGVKGVGQALIGAFVGIRFDKESLKSLRKIGSITVVIILMLFITVLSLTFIFKFLTHLDYATSLISIVPAGAPEMTVTAVALGIEPTIVASLHIIRLLTIFLLLPILLKIFNHYNA